MSCGQLVVETSKTKLEVEEGCKLNVTKVTRKLEIDQTRRGLQGKNGDTGFLCNVIEYTFGAFRYMVGDTDASGTVGKINRWQIGVGDAGQTDWTVTKPTTQAEIEGAIYT